MTALIPVILAGGAGTRLWPVSRELYPKQLVDFAGDASLLQQTARRLLARADAQSMVLVGASAQDFLVVRELGAIDPALTQHRLLEPLGRNTAAAIALAALYVRDRFGAASVLWVCPSDHLMQRPDALLDAIDTALPVAAAGELVTFGITPSRPEPGYGYVQKGEARPDAPGVFKALRFVEKPERPVAEAMLAEGGHLWNSGIFLFRADRILEELDAYRPDILRAVASAFAALETTQSGAHQVPRNLYESVPSAPIDKAVMEHSSRVAVVPCDPAWSDLGSWQALWEQLDKDDAGNAVRGDVLTERTGDCLIRAEKRLVALAGVRDLAVVETADAVLVADRNDADAVRRLVEGLKRAGRSEAVAHGEEHRPWGSFKVLHEGEGFKVKEIIVVPGGRLSLQSHRHRAEHWTVVRGTARVAVDDNILTLEPNQSVHIPLGTRHRMENPGDVPMHLIEVQCGDYLGEDDIVRYEDVYGRT